MKLKIISLLVLIVIFLGARCNYLTTKAAIAELDWSIADDTRELSEWQYEQRLIH